MWLTHSLDGRVDGLKNTPIDRQPFMGLVFYGFRVMYVTALLMFAVGRSRRCGCAGRDGSIPTGGFSAHSWS